MNPQSLKMLPIPLGALIYVATSLLFGWRWTTFFAIAFLCILMTIILHMMVVNAGTD